jgi:phosphonate transport system substrate-binding protein
MRAIKHGEVHIVGLNAGAVPIAVDSCGFVPIISFASQNGLATYTMQIIVPSGSPMKDTKQIGDRMIAFTESTSNSGWKAPMMVLWREFHLQPVRDFDVVYSGGHTESIRGIASHKFEVAAVASDELARAIARGDLGKDDFVVLYESAPFSDNAIGVPYNLDPQLADQIKAAFIELSLGRNRSLKRILDDRG